MSVQAKKKFVEDTSPSKKKIKIRTSTRKKNFSPRTNQYQSSYPIVIDESPQVSPKDHNLSVLADAVAHTLVNEENVEKEDDILFPTLVHRLRKKKTTSSEI